MMSTEIYYFTGTGNSLAVAKNIINKINGRIISIPSVIEKENIITDADVIGIVFPVYHATFGMSGMPAIVRRFIAKMKNLDSKYLFAICTHSGIPGLTIGNVNKAFQAQGGELSAGYTVKMGVPYPTKDKLKHALFHKALKVDISGDEIKRQKEFAGWEAKSKVIQGIIKERKKAKLETPGVIRRTLLAPFFLLQKQSAIARYRMLTNTALDDFEKLLPLADKNFMVNEKCNGCGICAKVCPVRNIVMLDNKPQWRHRCENCYACFQWCGREAIYGNIVEYEKRYHHPDVKITDVIHPESPHKIEE